MKLLIDENLSPRLVGTIADLYPGSRHIEECGLISASGDFIWSFARSNGFAILTKDSDFSDRGQLEESPPKVVWLRGGNCTTARAALVLRNAHERIRRFLDSTSETCLILFVQGRKHRS